MAKLVVLSQGLAGQAHELAVDTTTVGRVEDNAFQIPESSVSSHHAEIIRRGSEIVIKDLNSTNGTFINGQQITGEAVLKPGQILRLGTIELRLEDGSAPAAPAAPSAPASKPAAPAAQAGKKLPDHTMVIPQGVKLGGEAQTSVAFDKGAFAKKSNTGTKVFIIVAAGLGLILIAVILFFAFAKTT